MIRKAEDKAEDIETPLQRDMNAEGDMIDGAVLYEAIEEMVKALPLPEGYTRDEGAEGVLVAIAPMPEKINKNAIGAYGQGGKKYYSYRPWRDSPFLWVVNTPSVPVFLDISHEKTTVYFYSTEAPRDFDDIVGAIAPYIAISPFGGQCAKRERATKEQRVTETKIAIASDTERLERTTRAIAENKKELGELEKTTSTVRARDLNKQVEDIKKISLADGVVARNNVLYVQTKPITVTYENYRYSFGQFLLAIDTELKVSVWGEHEVGGCFHPYAEVGGRLCWGYFSDAIDAYRKKYMLYEIVQLAVTLLSSFSPENPYRNITNWIEELNAEVVEGDEAKASEPTRRTRRTDTLTLSDSDLEVTILNSIINNE